MKTFKVKQKCKSCKGTGIYIGFGERDGFGIVCHNCKGTGCYEFIHEYEEFVSMETRKDVKVVLQTNPGISVGTNEEFNHDSFGGKKYKDWLTDKNFERGTEMRGFVCPAWWYQSADYDLKPDWKECRIGGTFSSCSEFCNKHRCWERFDNENPVL